MGTEYYLIKPKNKELFYLGKHFSRFSGIPNTSHNDIARYPDYENWDDFFWNTLKENWEYFLYTDLTLEQVSNVIHEIYEWCFSDEVILGNDCAESASRWLNWKETGSITELLENISKERL